MSKKHNTDEFIGNTFNKLKVLEFIGVRRFTHKDRIRNKYFYRCLCECGNTTEIASSNFKTTKSCGCATLEGYKISANKQRGIPRPQIQKPKGESVLHSVFLAYKNGAKKRNITFNLTKDQFRNLTDKNCAYCGTPPNVTKKNSKDNTARNMNGIDRVDSHTGYELSNCVPCCKICNYMKHELSIEQWKNHMLKVLNHFFTGDKRLEEQ